MVDIRLPRPYDDVGHDARKIRRTMETQNNTGTENGKKRRGRPKGVKREIFFLAIGIRSGEIVKDEIPADTKADALSKFKTAHKGVSISEDNVCGPYYQVRGGGVVAQPPHLQIKVSTDEASNFSGKKWDAVYHGWQIRALGLLGSKQFKDNELVHVMVGNPIDPNAEKRTRPRFGAIPVMRLTDLEQVKEVKSK